MNSPERSNASCGSRSAVRERVAARFELVAVLGDMGLGEAWSALDLTADRRSALVKFLHGGERPLEPWSAVVERLRNLSGTKLPKVIDAGELADGRCWLALEPVKGRSLANWLAGHREAGTSPGPGVVRHVFESVSAAVQTGHGTRPKPMPHRGLSPASVMLEPSPAGHVVVLLDHEVAPFVDARPCLPYRAPEQLAGSGGEGPAADVFSLAVMLTELLSLRPVPQDTTSETWAELARRAPKQVRASLQSLRGDVPKDLWDVVAEALSADASKRPADAQTFARRVRQAIPREWRQLPTAEREPPAPVRLPDAARISLREHSTSALVPVGWVDAERRSAAPSLVETQRDSRADAAGAPASRAPSIDRVAATPPPMPGPSEPAVGGATLIDRDDAAGMQTLPLDGFDETVPTHGGAVSRSLRPRAKASPGHDTLVAQVHGDSSAWPDSAPVMATRSRRVGDDTIGLEDSIAFRTSANVGDVTLPLGPVVRPASSATVPIGSSAPPTPDAQTLPLDHRELAAAMSSQPRAFAPLSSGARPANERTLLEAPDAARAQMTSPRLSSPLRAGETGGVDARPRGVDAIPAAVWVGVSVAALLVIVAALLALLH